MNILVLQESNWSERGPHQQHHLMERLSLANHKVHVIDYDILWDSRPKRRVLKLRETFSPKGKTKEGSRILLIRPAIIQMPVLNYLSIPITHGLEIIEEIRRFKPDIIVSFGILNAFVGRKLSRLYGVPFACYLIDHLHTLLPLKRAEAIAKKVEGSVIASSDRVFVINKGLKDYAIAMGARPDDVSIVPGGVDAESYHIGSKSRESVRKDLGVSEHDTVLFFMGWLYDFSGLREVAEAIAKRKDSKFKLIVVGEGDAYNTLKEIKERNHMSSLLLLGKQPFSKIPEFLSAADICLLPADPRAPEMQNIVPIKLYEYLAAGKPVIATRLPGVLKEFGEGKGISYVSGPEEVLSMCEKIIQQTDMAEDGKKLQERSKQYDWGNIVSSFEDQLRGIATNGNAKAMAGIGIN